MQIIKFILAVLLVASPVWADGVLTPAAGPISGTSQSYSTLYDYTTSVKIQDDFCGGGTGTGSIGTLGWGTGGGTASYQVSESNHPCIVRKTTSAASGTFSYLYLPAVQASLLAGSVDMTYVYRLNSNDANTTCRIGAMALINIAPTDGIYIEKKDADTNWFVVTRASSTETRADSGVAISTGWFTFRIVRTNSASVAFYINGTLVSTSTTNIPSAGLTIGAQAVNSAAADKSYDVDYVEVTMSGLSR